MTQKTAKPKFNAQPIRTAGTGRKNNSTEDSIDKSASRPLDGSTQIQGHFSPLRFLIISIVVF